jgi:carbon monoxide dehydrogenase subunit G
MEFDNTLEVPLPPADAWKVLLDIRRIATCIPGAELTEVVDEQTYKGKVAVRLGPVALSLVGHAKFEHIDHAQQRARVKAHGSDPEGRGASDSVIDFRLERSGAGTRVLVHTDVRLSGSIAQYGRGSGMIQSFAQQPITQFGECLKNQLAQPSAAPAPADADAAARAQDRAAPPPPVKPISGLSLIVKSLWHWITGRR